MIPRRGQHGCYVHLDRRGSDAQHTRLVKSSYHSTRMLPPTPEFPSGQRDTTCTRCGATVTRTLVPGGVKEVWSA